MFIVDLHFSKDNIDKTSSFEEESYLCTKRFIPALLTPVNNQIGNQPTS